MSSITRLDDLVWSKNNTTWKNNRGCGSIVRFGRKQFIKYGIPEPTLNEDDESLKGGDRIGFRAVVVTSDMVGRTLAVFLNIEEKTVNDTLKPGQRKWHNFVLESGGLSEIWQEKKNGSIIITDTPLT